MTERALKSAIALSVVACNCSLGEGPLWDPLNERVMWLDILEQKLHIYVPAKNTHKHFNLPVMVSAIGLYQGTKYISARRGGFSILILEEDGPYLSPLKEVERDKLGNRFNDGKVDPQGGFWAGTMDAQENVRSGTWWRLAPSGEVVDATPNGMPRESMVTNGPAFDASRNLAYLTDSADQVIYVGDVENGLVKEVRVFQKFSQGQGHPDGMTIDSQGCLWVAFWDGACVRRFSPDGKLLETLMVPAQRPTSVIIVEDVLYITSAQTGLDALENPFRQNGHLFKAKLNRPLASVAATYGESGA